jgi:hypothetical protein
MSECLAAPALLLAVIQHTVRIMSGAKGDTPGGPIGGTSGPAKTLETRQKLKNRNLRILAISRAIHG